MEDFAHYWDLPNAAGAKHVYFQQIDYQNLQPEEEKDVFPIVTSIDEAILKDGKERRINLNTPYQVFSSVLGGAASICFYLYYLAL